MMMMMTTMKMTKSENQDLLLDRLFSVANNRQNCNTE